MPSFSFCPDTSEVQGALPEATISGQINGGGQKIVYKGEYQPYGTVALKLIRPSPASFERIMREIDAISKVSGSYFAVIHKHGTCKINGDDVIFVAEEFLEGHTLRERLTANRKLNLTDALSLGRAILEALNIVSTERLVHRDIKPENIILATGGRIVLLDFGIARHLDKTSVTLDAALFGPMTPGYAAPEQIRNEKRKISNRTDLFAWGILMYECLEGYNPFIHGCASQGEVLTKTLTFDPKSLESLGHNVVLSNIVRSCMNKALHRRPHSAASILLTIKDL